jgi:hypothetical protein
MVTTKERVPSHTRDDINRRIREYIARNVHFYFQHRGKIPERLRELDEEWDIERAIEANAAVIGFLGVTLSAIHGRRWLFLPALVTGFLFQHAVQGWCPPVPVLRRLGFRTSFEIEEERQALKALAGDDSNVHDAGNALQAAKSRA